MENNAPDLPQYSIRVRLFALRTIHNAFVYVVDTCGKPEPDATEYAADFRQGLYAALGKLATLPLRFPVAPEAIALAPPPVHVMPYQQRPGGPVWRVLYRIYEADESDPGRVEIVPVRHGSQQPLTRAEGRDLDAANR